MPIPPSKVRTAVGREDRVLLVDDGIETGSQAPAVRSMVEGCGGQWVGRSVVADLTASAQRADLGVRSVVTAVELPTRAGQY
ncbi:hypothetical protein [[Kitasatospora] papulosa]|uniref:hypothetical protein n=1 Tax=[Kitasatospora] papulosa TaxID=1464011 RepID=UPI0036B4E54D